jgi:LmbE family N-acetylglucosaminyl deacetylase
VTPLAPGAQRAVAPPTTDGSPRRPFTMLGVWAHPDDETYLSAALMRRVVAAGGHVALICATRGELGSEDSAADPRHLAARRERELRVAMAHLGVHDVWVLGHPDGGCAQVDEATAAEPLITVMRSARPDLVVTFGPDGITNHPDHRAVSRWTTRAWLAAKGSDHGRLLYATMTRSFVERHLREYADLPLTMEGPPEWVADHEVVLRVVPDADELRRKRAALAAHSSQVATLVNRIGEQRLHEWWVEETFREPLLLGSTAVPTRQRAG